MHSFCKFRVVSLLLLFVIELEGTSVPQISCPERNLTITADDNLRLYYDGVEITDLPNSDLSNTADVVKLPCTTRLVAVHGRQNPKSMVAGILASTDDEFVLSNSSWKCLNVSQPGWEEIDFDDSVWLPAIEYEHNEESFDKYQYVPGISTNASWIWLRQWNYLANSTYEEQDQNVYCRKRLAASFCSNNPCSFGGTCIEETNGEYQCICAPGYSGQNCTIVTNYCESSPCANGVECYPTVNGYVCNCSPGYTGANCEYVINNCVSSPCLHNGTCLNGINYYVCECSTEWTGDNCDMLLNPCSDHFCANGGTCFNYCGVPHCTCPYGFTGPSCLISIDPCASNPCENDGLCENAQGGLVCVCPPYFTGTYCETVIDLCSSRPCWNGGTCVFDCGVYQCLCPDAYTGPACQSTINSCNPNPCLNGGTCNNLGGTSFGCTCHEAWTGVRCESANYNESSACGTMLTWSQYNASNGFTSLCYFSAPPGDPDAPYIACRYTINGIPWYDDYTGLLRAGGNFGCLLSHNYPDDLPVTSYLSCADNYQQDISLGNYTESTRLMVCIRYP